MRRPGEVRVRYGDQKLEPVIGSKYRLEAEIGRGAFALVYRARHVSVSSLCYALKVLRQPLTQDPVMLQRFHQEAETAASLSSPHVVRVIDFGETEGGLPFIVMPLLKGMSSDRVLERDGHLSPTDVARLSLDVLKALSEAHSRGIVHRDLKPSNIFLTATQGTTYPVAKVLDFGLAKVLSETTDSSPLETAANVFLGTPAYAAPEMLSGEPHPRSDLYSLGHTMAAWLEGEPPFAREPTNALTIARHLAPEPVPLGPMTHVSGLLEVIERAVEKHPDMRYATAADMAAAIRATGLHDVERPSLDVLTPPEGGEHVSFHDATPLHGFETAADTPVAYAPNTPLRPNFGRKVGLGLEPTVSAAPVGRAEWVRRRLWSGLLVAGAIGVIALLVTLPDSDSEPDSKGPPAAVAALDAGPEAPPAESEPAPAPALGTGLDLAHATAARLELVGALERAQLVVAGAAEVRPSNVVDLAADVDEAVVFLGDTPLGGLPLRGAYVPSQRPLTLRFAVDGMADRSVTFVERGPVVYRLEVARELRRRARREERRETPATEPESEPVLDEEPGTTAEGEEGLELEPRRTDLRNPFE